MHPIQWCMNKKETVINGILKSSGYRFPKNNIKKILRLIIAACFMCCCNPLLPGDNKRNTKVMVSLRMPVRIVEGEGIAETTSVYINYYKDNIVYELPYHKTYEINNRLIYDSVKYEYFVCNDKDDFGYLFKVAYDSLGKKLNKDSILRSRCFGNWDLAEVFKEIKVSNTTYQPEDEDRGLYRYLFDNYFYDSARFYYDRTLTKISFSLSRKLDSINKSKLVKVDLFIKHNKDSAVISPKDFYVTSLEIKHLRFDNIDEIKSLCEKVTIR